MFSPGKVPKDLPLIAALCVLYPYFVIFPALNEMKEVSTSLNICGEYYTGVTGSMGRNLISPVPWKAGDIGKDNGHTWNIVTNSRSTPEGAPSESASPFRVTMMGPTRPEFYAGRKGISICRTCAREDEGL